jgi:glycosyltransferase involved in cell wall biosynthesis
MAKITIEGWRFLPHSFATVNQFQCLELLKRPGLELFHRDVPYWNANWTPVSGLLDAAREQALRAIPPPQDGLRVDATLKAGCPFDFAAAESERTVTFATCEFGRLAPEVLADQQCLHRPLHPDVRIITPSRWSQEGLVRSGLPAERITVVPHGVDPDLFHAPGAAERAALRQRFGWEGSFIFLHISAMTPNKGVPAMLRSLYEVGRRQPQARLVLKGLDSLYASTAALNNCLKELPPEIHPAIRPRVAYTSGNSSYADIANLYKAADAYLAPYLGEGFNLPVLEAAACGLPVICTGGGSTDDFTLDEFRLAINSTRRASGAAEAPAMLYLQPDQAHLTLLMESIMEDAAWRNRARRVAPVYVRDNFTWSRVADQLEDILLH